VTVLRPLASGALVIAAQSAATNPFVNAVVVQPRVMAALSVLPPDLGTPAIMQSFTLRGGGLPVTRLDPITPQPAFPNAGYGLGSFFAINGKPLLVVAGNGAGGAGDGPGEIRIFTVNLANSRLLPLLPKRDVGIVENPFLRLPGPNNLTGLAVFQPD
jgi:hypothetical protein